APVTDQHRVALRIIAGVLGALQNLHEATIGVLPATSGDTLGHDRRPGVLPHVDHLRAGVGLLALVRHRHRVELADGVVALEDAAGILPGDRRAGLDLRPRDLRVLAAARAALGDEVEDPAAAFLVARVPILDSPVL